MSTVTWLKAWALRFLYPEWEITPSGPEWWMLRRLPIERRVPRDRMWRELRFLERMFRHGAIKDQDD
ncbi:hypothetical protein SMC26_08825 [Actinomadura fulvescens]|uniref:Uncharacterized protein n=1 Tax=Actinomadura fulvescens TaxID=46160 RepID=A0ABN3QU63_9ACTN